MEALLYLGPLPPHEKSCASSDWASVHDCGISLFHFLKADESRWLFVHLSPVSLTWPNQHTHKPWVSCSSAPSHWCHLFLSNNWRKRKSEASIIRLFFFSKCLLLAYSCPSLFLNFFKVTVYALLKWICILVWTSSSTAQLKVSYVHYCWSATGPRVWSSVVLQCIGLYRRSRVIQCVCVVSRLSS